MAALQFSLDVFHRAAALRDPLRATDTNVLRLFNGSADGAPGVYVDDYAGHWLVSTRDAPFPRVIERAPGWASIHHKELARDERRPPVLVAGGAPDGVFEVRENGLRFGVDFSAGYSQGLFHDQRDNRQVLAEFLRKQGKEMGVLNCFAYTCAFSVAAAACGARTTSIDLAAPALEWGKRNFVRNGLEPGGHQFVRGDVLDWLRRFRRKGRSFDAVVLDPPTFSRGKDGRVFRVERDYGRLVEEGAELAPNGFLLCSCNQRSLTSAVFKRLVMDALPSRSGCVREIPMPRDFLGDPYLKTVVVEGSP